jgi:CheY-like chemotaxis protein
MTRSRSDASPTDRIPLPTPEKPLERTTILVVEDEYLIALEAQHMIEDAGAELVLLANSVGEVRKLLDDGPKIDAAVLDLKLGDEDARPLMDVFAARAIPFLLTTGFDGAATQGVKVLTKPYREAEFIDAVVELVHGRTSPQEP